jgi:transposase
MAWDRRPTLIDIEYRRVRAEEARATAESFTDPKASQTMLSIADAYDRIAEMGEQLLAEEAERNAAAKE